MNATLGNINGSCAEQAAYRFSLENPDEGEGSSTIALGIVMGLVASLAINFGQNWEDFNRPPKPPGGWTKNNPEPPANTGMWQGRAIFVIAAIMNFTAFAFAPSSVLAPLEGSQFVMNFAFGLAVRDEDLWDKKTSSWNSNRVGWVGLGTLLIIGGVVLPVVASPSTVARFDVDSIKCLWGRQRWWMVAGGGAAFAVVCYGLSLSRGEPSKRSRFDQLLYTGYATIMGAFSVVQAKIISELVELILRGDLTVFETWMFWQTLILVAIAFTMWIILLMGGPEKFARISIIPLLQGGYILFSSIGGGVFFDDFALFDTRAAVLFASGMALLVAGLYCIVPGSDPGATGIGAGGIPSLRRQRGDEYTDEDREPLTDTSQKLPGLFL